MKAIRASALLPLVIFAASYPAAFGQKKEQFAEMQRDIAGIQADLKTLQNAQADKLGELRGMLQQLSQTLDSTNTKMQTQLQESMQKQQSTVMGPVASLNTRLDQMAQSFQELRETILDMNGRVGKLDAKIQDLVNQQQLSARPAQPPDSGTAPAPGTSQPQAGISAPGGGNCASLPADGTYSNARRDYMAAQYDLAMQEFSDYLRCFPTTTYAPNAQFYIGDIYYKKADYDEALKAFDKVTEAFPENNKTGDAHYMKGNTLIRLSKKEAALKEYRTVVSKYPDTDSAVQAKAKLRELGAGTATTRRR
jgi:tol-pal system protein YbgF